MRRGIGAFVLILVGGMAWIRLAPDDPARWNRASYGIQDPIWTPGPTAAPFGPDAVIQRPEGAAAVVKVTGMRADEVLARLDAIVLTTSRTIRLAGSSGEGRITWVTRSAFFGFPDYTTAEARSDGTDSVVSIYARLRYGRGDFGVNAARLRDWLARLSAD